MSKVKSNVTLSLVSAAITDASLYPVQLPGNKKVQSDGLLRLALKRLRLTEGSDFTMQKHQSGVWILVGRPEGAEEVLTYLFSLEPTQYSIKRIEFTSESANTDYDTSILVADTTLRSDKPKLVSRDLTLDGIKAWEFGADSAQLHVTVSDGIGKRGREKGITVQLALRDTYCDMAVTDLVENGYQYHLTYARALKTLFDNEGTFLGTLLQPTTASFERTREYAASNKSLSITTARLIAKYYPSLEDATKWLADMYTRIAEDAATPTLDTVIEQADTNPATAMTEDEYNDMVNAELAMVGTDEPEF